MDIKNINLGAKAITPSVKDWLDNDKALDALMKSENYSHDAKANFDLVQRNLKKGENIFEATKQFVKLLRTMGKKNTAAVQATYSTINESLKAGETREEATDACLKVINTVHSKPLAVKGECEIPSTLKVIGDSRKDGESWSEVTDEMIRIASHENFLGDSISDYLLIDKYVSPQQSRKELTDQFLRILENAGGKCNTFEAQENFKLIHP